MVGKWPQAAVILEERESREKFMLGVLGCTLSVELWRVGRLW